MREEVWKEISQYKGYSVSNLGRVTNPKGKILSVEKNQKGYCRVNINGKHLKVHRLVAMAFIPNPDKLPQVNHKNEIKADNRVENLEWIDNQTNYILNSNKAHGKKRVILIDNGQEFESIKEAARQIGISRYSITAACEGRQRTAGGKRWKYAD